MTGTDIWSLGATSLGSEYGQLLCHSADELAGSKLRCDVAAGFTC